MSECSSAPGLDALIPSGNLLVIKGLPEEGTEWEKRVSFMLVTGLGGQVSTMWAKLSGFSGWSGNMGCKGSRLEAQLRDLLNALVSFLAGDFHEVYSFIWCWLLWEPPAWPLQKQS